MKYVLDGQTFRIVPRTEGVGQDIVERWTVDGWAVCSLSANVIRAFGVPAWKSKCGGLK